MSVFISGPDDGNKRENTLAGIVMNRDIRTHVWIVSFDKERYRGPFCGHVLEFLSEGKRRGKEQNS